MRQGLTSGDTEASVEVVDHGEDGGVELHGDPVRRDEAHERHDDDEVGVDPVDVLVPVAPCHGGLGNVRLLHIVALGPQGDVLGRPVRGGDVDAG